MNKLLFMVPALVCALSAGASPATFDDLFVPGGYLTKDPNFWSVAGHSAVAVDSEAAVCSSSPLYTGCGPMAIGTATVSVFDSSWRDFGFSDPIPLLDCTKVGFLLFIR